MAVQQTRAAEAVDFRPDLDLITGVVQRPREAPPRTGLLDVLGAAFENENTVVSYATQAQELLSNQLTPVDGYSSWSEVRGTPYEDAWDTFAGSQSPAETTMLKARVDRERENDRTLAAAGFGGFLAQLAAGTIDPTVLVPVGGELRLAGKGLWSISQSALRVGAAGAAGTAIQEGILQGTQATRTTTEGVINIASGAVLSGLLGGGAAAVLNRVERAGAERALENIATGAGVAPRQPVSAGAAAVERATLDDLSMSTSEGFGGAAEGIARSTQIVSPNLQAQFSPSPRVRQITQMLTENTLYQRMNDSGRTLGASAETNARVSFEGRTATALRESDAIFKEAKKANVGMSRAEFEEAVGRAMRRGDKGENDFVDRAAQAWRKSVFEPYQNEALDLSLLGEKDVKTTTAESYLPRQYKRPMLVKREREFKDTVASHYEGVLKAEFEASTEALTKRLAAAEQRLQDLRLTPDQRLQALDEIKGQGARLDAAQPDAVARVSAINDLRMQKKAATSAGDNALAKALQAKIEAEKLAGGEQLKSYLADRRRLRERRRDVDMNFAGLDARHDAIMQSLVDVEEANLSSLNRLVERGRKLERELQRLDPDEAARKVSDLRTSFIQIAEKADKALDRAAARLRKMEEADAKQRAEGGEYDPKDKVQRTMVEKEIAAQRNRSERMSRIADRLEAADEFDLDATTAEIRASVDGLIKEVSDLSLGRGEKAQRLKDRLENLDPKVVKAKEAAIEARKVAAQQAFDERWRQSLDEDGIGFTGAARNIADDAHAKLTGTDYGEAGLDFADHRAAVSRGPLKDRTLNVPDQLIEDFLESNIRDVGERYARTMAGEVELTRRFGRADMRDQITEITDDYAALRAAVPEGEGREAALKALDDRMALDVKNVQALRDLTRGTYMGQATNSVGGRVMRGLTTYNYVRSMGSAAISNLSDLYRSAMVYGIGPFVSEGLAPMLTNLKAAKLSRDDAKLMGLVTEMHTQHRMMSMGEMGDPYRSGTGIERLLTTSARVASNWNGINLMTDISQAIAATLSQNRILVAATGKKDARLLAYLGIDEEMAGRIAKEFRAHGETESTVRVANTQEWTDDAARRAYQAAVSKDVNSVVVVKSVGDVPLLANHPLGKALIQFRTFALASHQRVLLRGLQESKSRFVSGLVTMTALGALVSSLAALRGGDERFEKFKTKVAANPGYLIGEGLDRSGIFALGVEIGNTTEVLTRPTGFAFNPVKTPFIAAGAALNPEASAQADSGRTANRGYFGAVAGPSVGLLDKDLPGLVSTAAKLATGRDPSASEMRSAQATIPFGSYLGFKEVLQALQGDSPYTPDQ